MQLSILRRRLLRDIPEKHHETIEKEFSRFEMESSRLSEEPDKIGQATLTDREIARATTTNQNGNYGHTIIELQAIKGVAMYHGIDDWLSYVDPELTYEENISIIESECKPTSKEINAKKKKRGKKMDVDILEDEVIIYLDRDDIKKLKAEGSIHNNIVTSLSEGATTVEVDFDEFANPNEQEHYDDVMEALHESYMLCYELFEMGHVGSIDDVSNDYRWDRIMNTYEYYDNIRSNYE